MIAAGKIANAVFPHILIVHPADQVVEEAFPQCAAGCLHIIDVQRFEQAAEDRQTTGKYLSTLGVKPRD